MTNYMHEKTIFRRDEEGKRDVKMTGIKNPRNSEFQILKSSDISLQLHTYIYIYI